MWPFKTKARSIDVNHIINWIPENELMKKLDSASTLLEQGRYNDAAKVYNHSFDIIHNHIRLGHLQLFGNQLFGGQEIGLPGGGGATPILREAVAKYIDTLKLSYGDENKIAEMEEFAEALSKLG